jgi:two-component system, NarL family, invasion response regulator UvrY
MLRFGLADSLTGEPMVRVLIADDHALIRSGLMKLLQEDRSIREMGEAATGEQTLDRLRESRWDLLLLDINMPDRNGLDILKHVRSGFPDTRVLVLSGYPERQYARNVLRAGASGYLAKDSASEELLRAVRIVIQGRRYVSASLAELLVNDLDADADQPIHSQLSEREFQIFCKIAVGKSVSDIAEELCLSVKTVSTYRSRVLEKMSFKNNADITSYALRNGLMQ